MLSVEYNALFYDRAQNKHRNLRQEANVSLLISPCWVKESDSLNFKTIRDITTGAMFPLSKNPPV